MTIIFSLSISINRNYAAGIVIDNVTTGMVNKQGNQYAYRSLHEIKRNGYYTKNLC